MLKYIIGLIAGLLMGSAGIAFASGAAPQEVDLNVPCQSQNQLNCTWYGQSYAPGTSENPPPYTAAFWYNWAKPDQVTFCRYRLVPDRRLTCATHWPLTQADEYPTSSAARR